MSDGWIFGICIGAGAIVGQLIFKIEIGIIAGLFIAFIIVNKKYKKRKNNTDED